VEKDNTMQPQASQFDVARKKAEQQSRSALQEQQEALKRRFASLGATSSGAAIKQQQIAAEKSQEQLQGAQEAIGAAETAENLRRSDIKEEREFQRGMAEEGRKFAIAEREAGQSFQAGQTQRQMDFQQKVQDWSQSQAGKEFDLAFAQFEQDKEATDYNKRLQSLIAGKDLGLGSEQMEKLLGSGGTAKDIGSILDQQRAAQAAAQPKLVDKNTQAQAAQAQSKNIPAPVFVAAKKASSAIGRKVKSWFK
jgi:hypothetical protein